MLIALWILAVLCFECYYIFDVVLPSKEITVFDVVFILMVPTMCAIVTLWLHDSSYDKVLFKWGK